VHLVQGNDTAQALSIKMYRFFVETLKNNYRTSDEQKLFEEFLTEYSNNWESRDKNEEFSFDIEIDTQKLKKITLDLLTHDHSHYYYFFQEIIMLRSKEEFERKKEYYSLHPDIPMGLFMPGRTNPNLKKKVPKVYEVHAVYLNPKGGFMKDLQKNRNLTICGNIEGQMDMGMVAFYRLAAYVAHRDRPKKELQSLKSREAVAIIFWKFLCLEADVEFHKPPKELLEY
jgi:hypothetical protein